MAEIRKNIIKQGKRNAASRIFHAKEDKDAIAAWRQDLTGVLHVFNVRLVGSVWLSLTASLQTELAINTHAMVSDLHRNASTSQGGARAQHHSVNTTPYLPAKEY